MLDSLIFSFFYSFYIQIDPQPILTLCAGFFSIVLWVPSWEFYLHCPLLSRAQCDTNAFSGQVFLSAYLGGWFQILHILIQLSWILFSIPGEVNYCIFLVLNNAFDLVCLYSKSWIPLWHFSLNFLLWSDFLIEHPLTVPTSTKTWLQLQYIWM